MMINKTVKGLVAAAVLVAGPVMAGQPGAAPRAGAQQQRQQHMGMDQQAMQPFQNQAPRQVVDKLKSRVKEYERAWNEHDVDKMAEFYTPGATYLTMMSSASGPQEIRRTIEQEHQGAMGQTRTQIELRSVRQLAPGMAILDMRQRLENAPADMPQEAHVTAIVALVDDEWKVHALRAFPAPGAQMGVGGAGMMPPPEEEPMTPPVQEEPILPPPPTEPSEEPVIPQ